jgi:acyl-CoA dehydrogenase
MCAALTLTEQVKQIANDVAAVHADAVDREARFPHEAIAALKQAGLMSAYVPQSLGGAGVSLRELVVMCDTLAACLRIHGHDFRNASDSGDYDRRSCAG